MAENHHVAEKVSTGIGVAGEGAPSGLTTYSTQELFTAGDEIHIIHQGETYRMRITRNRKLILTK